MGNSSPSICDLAIKTLFWIALAYRELTMSEMREALAAASSGKSFWYDRNNLVDEKFVLKHCEGLVVEGENGKLRLIHKSLHDFLLLKKGRQMASPYSFWEAAATKACIRYICTAAEERPLQAALHFAADRKTRKRLLQRFPFISYATHYWRWHAQQSSGEDMDDDLRGDLRSFLFDSPKALATVSVAVNTFWEDVGINPEFHVGALENGVISPLHISAWSGIPQLVEDALVIHGTQVSAVDVDGNTALHLAAYCGELEVTKVLLAHPGGKELVFCRNKRGVSPIQYASNLGHLSVMKRLLMHDCLTGPRLKLDIHDVGKKDGMLLISNAIDAGELPLIRTLYSFLDGTRQIGEAVLYCLVSATNHEILQFFLDRDDIDVSIVPYGPKFLTLANAADQGDYAAVRLHLAQPNTHPDNADYIASGKEQVHYFAVFVGVQRSIASVRSLELVRPFSSRRTWLRFGRVVKFHCWMASIYDLLVIYFPIDSICLSLYALTIPTLLPDHHLFALLFLSAFLPMVFFVTRISQPRTRKRDQLAREVSFRKARIVARTEAVLLLYLFVHALISIFFSAARTHRALFCAPSPHAPSTLLQLLGHLFLPPCESSTALTCHSQDLDVMQGTQMEFCVMEEKKYFGGIVLLRWGEWMVSVSR
ncbi:ankyrin [Ascobolus immersus RN42]|uniref:Ankyrin n=1 Tax=Ascobolus immersus RN42 TaxID=1160509 RepID=A0A3N4I3H5_ASCIM|nr:ankyrin [Ascobolus immersus RN42]